MTYNYPFKSTDEKTKRAVFNKGRIIAPDENGNHLDPNEWRYDQGGKLMKYSDHGNTNKDTGWEIDHKIPTAKNGLNTLDNLQPLQWENNRKKSDTYPYTFLPYRILPPTSELHQKAKNVLPPISELGQKTKNVLPSFPERLQKINKKT
ncbi:MAG: HNH endonuclease [Candidatus Electrothrix sp. LOE1_4_5]|nr:HNH endonuclease [Candidatus Electrothrix gigas]